MCIKDFEYLKNGRRIVLIFVFFLVIRSMFSGLRVTSQNLISHQPRQFKENTWSSKLSGILYSARNIEPKVNAQILPDFVQLKAKCKVPEGSDRNSLPPCSHALFREYYSTMEAFPECGMWVESEGYGFSQRYNLDFCELQAYNWPECSLSKKMHHLLMMGDSTSMILFMALVNATIFGGNTCKLVKHEGPKSKLPSKKYFSLGQKSLEESFNIQKRECGTCRAVVYDCEMRTYGGFHTTRLEFVPAYKFRDQSLTLSNRSTQWPPSGTFQEFLFKTFLPMTGFADVIVVGIPLNHEKKNARIVYDLRELLDAMMKHVPRSTHVHWVPTASEFEGKRSIKSKINATFGRNQLMATEQIYKINTQLFKVLKPFFLNTSYNMHGFVNLVNMSSTKEDWNEDGVHFNNLWYYHVVKTLLSLLCES